MPVVAAAAPAPAFAVSCGALPSLAMPSGWSTSATTTGTLSPNTAAFTNGYKTYTPGAPGPMPSSSADSVTRFWAWQDDDPTVAGGATSTVSRSITGLVVGQTYVISYSTQMGPGNASQTLRRATYTTISVGGTVRDQFATDATTGRPTGYPVLTATTAYPVYDRSFTFTATTTTVTLSVATTVTTRTSTDQANDDIGVGEFAIRCA